MTSTPRGRGTLRHTIKHPLARNRGAVEDEPTVTSSAVAKLIGPVMLAAVILFIDNDARANIAPPPGKERLENVDVSILNPDAFPDHLLVAWHCYGVRSRSRPPYCILRPGDKLTPEGAVVAIAKQNVKTREKKAWDADAGPPPLVIVDPAIADVVRFFAEDQRVIRPGFDLGSVGRLMQEGSGVRAATFLVEITGVSSSGVSGRFVRARYECSDRRTIEVSWGPKQDEPPPSPCRVGDEASPSPAQRDATPATAAPDAPFAWSRRSVWIGIALGLAGVVAVALLLRSRRR